MRLTVIALYVFAPLASGMLSACATAPQPSFDAPDPYLQTEAQLRELRNAEGRVRLARAQIDFGDGVDADDLREFQTARAALRRLQSIHSTLDTGERRAYHPLALVLDGPVRHARPVGFGGATADMPAVPVTSTPLSGIR